MRDADLSSAESGSSSRGYQAQAQMEPSDLGLDDGQGCRSIHPRNVVQPRSKGSQKRRNTSQCKHGNTPLRSTDPHSGNDEDAHDDWDNYWSSASLQDASGDALDVGTARSAPGGWDSDATEDEEPHSY